MARAIIDGINVSVNGKRRVPTSRRDTWPRCLKKRASSGGNRKEANNKNTLVKHSL